MSLRTFCIRLALAAVCALPLAAGASSADTVTDKPRLVVLLPTTESQFTQTLKTKLDQTRRFQVLEKANLKTLLSQKKISLDGNLSVKQSREALAVAGADLVLDGAIDNRTGALRVTGRLYDFRTGEITRDLTLIGEAGDAEALAAQLASFVRHSVPVRCLIKAIDEDQVVLDLGAMDGVASGSMYKVYRHPLNLKPREIGLVRVTAVQPFAAVAEVESTVSGATLEPGDVLVEQTSSLLLGN